MMDAQRDQQIRIQICVHMGVKIRPELAFPEDIGLHDGLPEAQPIVLRLAHERLGDGGNGGLPLDPPVRIDVRNLGVQKPEYVEHPVLAVNIAGQLPPDHLQAVRIRVQRKTAEKGQVGDQIARAVVRRAQNIADLLLFQEQLHLYVLFLIQIKKPKGNHASTSPARFGMIISPGPLPVKPHFRSRNPVRAFRGNRAPRSQKNTGRTEKRLILEASLFIIIPVAGGGRLGKKRKEESP